MGEALGLLQGAAQRALQRLAVAAGRQVEEGHLELGPQHGDRRAQLVAGVVEEHPLPGEGGLDPVEHGVEGAAQLGDLVLPRGLGQAAPGLGQGDGIGLLAHPPDGPQRRPGQQPPAGRQQGAEERAEDGQDERQPLAPPEHGVGGGADDDHQRPPVRRRRVGQDAGPMAERRRVGDAPVEEQIVTRRPGHLGRRQGGGGRRRGVDHRGPRPEDLGEGLLLADLDPAADDVGGDVVGPGDQAGVDGALQLAVEVEVDEDAGQDQDGGAAGREEQGEPAPQGDRGERPPPPAQELSPAGASARGSPRRR